MLYAISTALAEALGNDNMRDVSWEANAVRHVLLPFVIVAMLVGRRHIENQH